MKYSKYIHACVVIALLAMQLPGCKTLSERLGDGLRAGFQATTARGHVVFIHDGRYRIMWAQYAPDVMRAELFYQEPPIFAHVEEWFLSYDAWMISSQPKRNLRSELAERYTSNEPVFFVLPIGESSEAEIREIKSVFEEYKAMFFLQEPLEIWSETASSHQTPGSEDRQCEGSDVK